MRTAGTAENRESTGRLVALAVIEQRGFGDIERRSTTLPAANVVTYET